MSVLKRRAKIGRKAPMKGAAFEPSAPATIAPRRKTALQKALDRWAIEVKDRDGRVCRRCGGEGSHAHHLMERGRVVFRPVRLDLRNGIALCHECHLLWAHKSDLTLRECRRWWVAKDPDGFGAIYDPLTDRPRREVA